MIYEGFEKLIAWKKARIINKMIYKVTSKKIFSEDPALQNQIRRTSVSISSNIAEGWGRRSKKEFVRYLDIAKGSCNELKSQLYLAMDVGFIDKSEFKEIFELTDEVSRAIYGLIKHMAAEKSGR